jgi:saccharopine dehydrogenase (NAD+, L-lysine-forming)
MTKPWMIYGANGYTGKLCAEIAAERGTQPILAGRNAQAVRDVADRFGFAHRVFALNDPNAFKANLSGVGALLLCAGPFSETHPPALEACLEMRCHYLDITGEISIFESCRRADDKARAAGITLLPGTGFDVVPSDCLANMLKRALPDADTLELAFAGETMSKGTAKTAVSRAHEGGVVRRDGKLVPMKTAALTKVIPFRDKARFCMNIPWGDISTAYQSTRIPNITVYTATSKKGARATRLFGPLLKIRPMQWFAEKMVERYVEGPNEEARATKQSQFWGQVSKGEEHIAATMTAPEAYVLTARTSVDATLRVLAGEIPTGSLTPAMAFGADYIKRFDGVTVAIDAISSARETSAG